MQRNRRFNSFDSVTVRAAARLVRMARAGRIASWELDYYVRELVMMTGQPGDRACRSLKRLAERLAAFWNSGVSGARGPSCRARIPVDGRGAKILAREAAACEG